MDENDRTNTQILFLQFNCRYRHRIEFEIYKLLVVIIDIIYSFILVK